MSGTKQEISAAEAVWRESDDAIAAVDAIFDSARGLTHGRRQTRRGAWKDGERVKTPRASRPVVKAGKANTPGVVRVAAWEQLPWLRAGFSTRAGGESTVYSGGSRRAQGGELNLGWTRDDEAALVAANRASLMAAVTGATAKRGRGQAPWQLVTLRQTHTPVVRVVDAGHGPLATADGKAVLRGDAVMTDVPGLLLGVQTADCVPVLVVDPVRRVVAAFHAGWRGTLARIVERGIGTLRLRYGSEPGDLLAAVGPAIGACCYAVGREVRHEFESQFAYAPELFSEVYDSDPVRDKYPLLFLTARAPGHSDIGPQIHVDLHEANRRQLLDAGVRADAITTVGECTACTREKNGQRRYFSHRGESGFTGRMLSVVGIAPEG